MFPFALLNIQACSERAARFPMPNSTPGWKYGMHGTRRPTLKEQMATMKEEKNATLEQMATLEQDIVTLQQENATLRQEMATLKQEIATLKQQADGQSPFESYTRIENLAIASQ